MKNFLTFENWLYENKTPKKEKIAEGGASSKPEDNDSHEILTAILCLLPKQKVEKIKSELTKDASSANIFLPKLKAFAEKSISSSKLKNVELHSANVESIVKNPKSPAFLAKAVSAALKIIDVAKTSFKNTPQAVKEDEFSAGTVVKSVYLTGNAWDEDIATYSGVDNLHSKGVESCGMKDFNSSDIVLSNGKSFLGVSLKHKDRVKSQDPTVINRAFTDTLNFNSKTRDNVNAAITSALNSILKDEEFLNKVFGTNKKVAPPFVKAIVDQQLGNIIGSYDYGSKSYLSLSDILKAINVPSKGDSCKKVLTQLKDKVNGFEQLFADETSVGSKLLKVGNKEAKTVLDKDQLRQRNAIKATRSDIRATIQMLIDTLKHTDKDALNKIYVNIGNCIRANLSKADPTDSVLWTIAFSETKGIMNDKYEPPGAAKQGTRIKDEVRRFVNAELANPKKPYKLGVQKALNNPAVASNVANQLANIIFKADAKNGLNILRELHGFDFGLCTGIAVYKKGQGKSAKPSFSIAPAEYEPIEKVTSLMIRLKKDKTKPPKLVAIEGQTDKGGAVTLPYYLNIGGIDVAKVEIRYKGDYTSSPTFTATITKAFKDELEKTDSNVTVVNTVEQ